LYCSQYNAEAFRNEIALLIKLKGVFGITELKYFSEDSENCYLTMEYCNRGNLGELLRTEGGRMAINQTAYMLKYSISLSILIFLFGFF
jgi:serine/threonine protein kinase